MEQVEEVAQEGEVEVVVEVEVDESYEVMVFAFVDLQVDHQV